MPLFKLNADLLYGQASRTPDPEKTFATSIARWLERAAARLEAWDYVFESGSAQDLASEFRQYAEDDGTPEGLARLWNDLDDWGQASVTSTTRRERSLCEIPHLPDALSC